MKVIHAKRALTSSGWKDDVLVSIDDTGRISSIQTAAKPTGTQVNVLLPAPVNSHSHAFQRAMAGLTESRGENSRDSFWTWRKLMYQFLDHLTPDHVQAIAALVQMEMLESGYATNVEFHYLHHQTNGELYGRVSEMADRIMAAASETGIGLCILPVHYEFGGCDGRDLGAGQRRFGNNIDQFQLLVDSVSETLRNCPADWGQGVAPHSLRAVGPEHLRTYTEIFRSGPIHMHLAEQIPEVDEVLNSWGARPVDWAMENMDVNDRWCMIHCTQMTPSETIRLANSGATAGLCPITESNLGDGIFDAVRWLDHSGSMSVGSDSNIRISLSEELRTLEYSQRLRDHSRAALATQAHSTGRRLYDACLFGGAKAAQRESGAIAVGYWADLLAMDTRSEHLIGREDDDLIDSWVFAGNDGLVSDVWAAGRHMVQEGRHISREQIVSAYRAALGDLIDII